MELSCSLLEAILEPTFVFQGAAIPTSDDVDFPWDSSALNPKNRLCSLHAPAERYGWHIDGGTSYGTRLFTVPTVFHGGWTPLRIDTFIPDQAEHPPALRPILQSSRSVCTRGSHLGSLGISHHICNALDYHFQNDPSLWSRLEQLPFGSKLVFENIALDVKDMRLRMIPAYDLERQLLSVRALRALWADHVAEDVWPETITLDKLVHQRQLHDSITVVRIRRVVDGEEGVYVFKSTTSEPKFLYHELKLLLTMGPHPHVTPAPLYLVVKKSAFGGKLGVCGFILPYYAGGSLREAVPRMARAGGALSLQTKCRWARQITSTLVHLRSAAPQQFFYSDLRPDNVLLKGRPRRTGADDGRSEDVVLVDFEQRGNWGSWTAPEIRALECLQDLKDDAEAGGSASATAAAAAAAAPFNDNNEWRGRLLRYAHLLPREDHHLGVRRQKYGNRGHGFNNIWFSLSPDARESAEAYALGLLLYCLFEGLSNPRNNLATSFEIEPHIEFPEFQQTPHALRQCILRCTGKGPSSWNATDSGGTGIYRQGGELILTRRGRTFSGAPPAQLSELLTEAVKEHWETELAEMERILKRMEDGVQRETRPSLKEILKVLDELDC